MYAKNVSRFLSLLAFVAAGCAGTPPAAQVPESVPSSRCPFADASYPNGERICDRGQEMVCRTRGRLDENGWYPTGNACQAGEPLVTSR
jgi:hypothetical protein